MNPIYRQKNIEVTQVGNKWLLEVYYHPGKGITVDVTEAESASTFYVSRSRQNDLEVNDLPFQDGSTQASFFHQRVPHGVFKKAVGKLCKYERILSRGKLP